MEFKDHFSKLAEIYAKSRPRYPDSLFDYLAAVAPGRELAWDCGTGNGQAAVSLARHFEQVWATDASPEQIEYAQPHPRVTYRVEAAEHVSVETGSCDLVTVAIAVHWFDLDLFYKEVRRVLKPGGVLAVWTYHLPVISPEIDRIVLKYYAEVLQGYWPERIHYVDKRYQTLPFPFEELSAPTFNMLADWDLDQLAGFLASWSAAKRFYDQRGYHPLDEIWESLALAWGPAANQRHVSWPLHLRVGQRG